jgi:hypothetical protein
VTQSDEALNNATICWYVPNENSQLVVDDKELKELGFLKIDDNSPYMNDMSGYVGYTKKIICDNDFKGEDGTVDTRMFQYTLNKVYSSNWKRNDI